MLNPGSILMTVAIVMYGVIPLIADLNRTHATNPSWTSHARFHVVTQVLTSSAIAVISLWLIWSPRIDPQIGICVATVLSLSVVGAFFVAASLRQHFGGSLSDQLSDQKAGIAQRRRIDLNAMNFGIAAALLIVGRLLHG